MVRDWLQASDPEGEWRESWRQGRSSQVWPIAERYEIAGELIRQSPNARYLYWPMARPRLPFELAKVKLGDQDAALAFVNEWGLLGYNRLAAAENRVSGEPLGFIWHEAKNIRDLLAKIRALQYPDPNRSQDEEEKDLREIQLVLSGRLRGIHPSLEMRDAEAPTGEPLSRLRRAFDWDVLLQVVYWHIWNLIEGGHPLAVCQECGELFSQFDSRQRFCPAPEEEVEEVRAGMRTRAQSKCGLRYRQEKLRKPKGEGHEQAR